RRQAARRDRRRAGRARRRGRARRPAGPDCRSPRGMARFGGDDAARRGTRSHSLADDGGAAPVSTNTEHVEHHAVVELIRRDRDQAEYDAIRELWKRHSTAEDARDLPGLIATLSDDCVYELPQTGHRWESHDGAARFYTELLTAFPDIHFDLT